jgi:hypothetical protein
MQSILEEDLSVEELIAPYAIDAEDDAMAKDVSREVAAQLKVALPEAIEAAFRAREPHGRFAWLRKNILNIGVVGVLVAVIGWLAGNCLTFYRDANNRLADQKQFEQKTNDRLEAIEKSLDGLKGQLLAGTIQQLSSSPVDKTTVANIQKTIEKAKSQNVRLEPSDLKLAGQHLVSVSQTSPEAWQAAQALLSYRTFLNSDVTANLNTFTVPPNTTLNLIPRPQNLTGGQFDLLGPATKDNQARLIELGMSNVRPPGEYGPNWIRIKGGTLKLDGLLFKKVVIEGAVIRYDGGPISLVDVYFVNCRFEMPLRKNTEMFADMIFSTDPKVDLRAS